MNKRVVILVPYAETKAGKKTGRKLVDFGIVEGTLETINFPLADVKEIGYFDKKRNNWVLREK